MASLQVEFRSVPPKSPGTRDLCNSHNSYVSVYPGLISEGRPGRRYGNSRNREQYHGRSWNITPFLTPRPTKFEPTKSAPVTAKNRKYFGKDMSRPVKIEIHGPRFRISLSESWYMCTIKTASRPSCIRSL